MAATATLVKRHGVGGITTFLATLAFTGNYATGGDSLDFVATFGYTNRQPDFVQIDGVNGYTFQYDFTNKKIMVFTTAATELAAAGYPAGITGDTQIKALVVYIGTPKIGA